MSERESDQVETVDPTIRGKMCIQASKVKKIDKQTKTEPAIKFWDDTNKNITQKECIHSIFSQTTYKI